MEGGGAHEGNVCQILQYILRVTPKCTQIVCSVVYLSLTENGKEGIGTIIGYYVILERPRFILM